AHIGATISSSGTWRIIARLRGAQCTRALYGRQTSPAPGTARLELNGADDTDCEGSTANRRPNPMAIAYMEGVTSATKVTLAGRGFEAIALGVVLANDFGDAPSTYGPAGAIVQPRFTGGAVSSSSSPGQD